MTTETVESLCQKAQQAVAQGKAELARELYLRALNLRSDIPAIHYGLATVCYLLRDWSGAAFHFKEVTRLDPQQAGAYINLGAVYNKLDRLEEAVECLRRGIQLDVNRAEGYYNLGLVYRRLGQADLAIQAYREATRLHPRMTDGHYNLANLYLEREQFDLALRHYQKALELRPNWEKALHGLEQARSALAEVSGPSDDSSPPIEESTDDTSTQQMVDPDREVDPEKHGTILTKLHRATVDSQTLASDFLDILQNEIEPSIKMLSNRLLQLNLTNTELDGCVQKVEESLAHMETAELELEKRMNKIRKYTDRMMQI